MQSASKEVLHKNSLSLLPSCEKSILGVLQPMKTLSFQVEQIRGTLSAHCITVEMKEKNSPRY